MTKTDQWGGADGEAINLSTQVSTLSQKEEQANKKGCEREDPVPNGVKVCPHSWVTFPVRVCFCVCNT